MGQHITSWTGSRLGQAAAAGKYHSTLPQLLLSTLLACWVSAWCVVTFVKGCFVQGLTHSVVCLQLHARLGDLFRRGLSGESRPQSECVMQPQLLLVLVCMALASTALIMWARTPEQRDCPVGNHSSYCSGETGCERRQLHFHSRGSMACVHQKVGRLFMCIMAYTCLLVLPGSNGFCAPLWQAIHAIVHPATPLQLRHSCSE
jgi:hypothetical protein